MDRCKVFPVVLLLAALFAQAFFSMQTKAPTCDEFAHHTASGFSHLVTGDFRMNPAEPPFSRLLSAIPLYFLGVKAPLNDASWDEGNSPAFAQKFFYQEGLSQDKIIFWARLPIVFLSILFGYFVYIWARELFGLTGGLVALSLYVFCPDILAHSGLATSDISIAFFFYMTLWRYWKYLHKQSRKNLILAGAMAGLAFLSKFSAVMLFPVLFLITAFTGSWKKVSLIRVVAFLSVCFLTVWAGYFFEMKPLLKNTPDPPKKIEAYRAIGGEGLVRFANDIPVPLSTFTSAFTSMMVTRAKGTNAFFMGEWSQNQKGWWNYYPVAFGIKNTLPSVILILISLACFFWLPAGRTPKSFLLIPIVFFFFATMSDKAQAGIRYFLPIYPLFFILCGGWAAWVWNKNNVAKAAIVGLLSWHALEACFHYPNHLSYFNQVIGGSSQGYRYLRDSNLDWGQDLKGASEWLKSRDRKEIVLRTISPVDMKKAYGIAWRLFTPEEDLNPGAYVYVMGVHDIESAQWTQQIKPTKIIGHSVWIYDFTDKESV